MFWGIVIITIGVIVLLNAIFGFDLPIFRILIGVLLVYWGLKVLLGSFSITSKVGFSKVHTETEIVFTKGTFQYSKDKKGEFATVFGSSVLDLSSMTEIPAEKLEFNVVFGESELILPKGIPAIVRATSVLGNTTTSANNKNMMGEVEFKNSLYQEGQPALTIEANTVFGKLQITEK